MNRFTRAFSSLLALSSSIAFLLISSEDFGRRYDHHFRHFFRSGQELYINPDADRLWNDSVLNAHFSKSQGITTEQRTQNIIYTGDIPALNSLYLIPSWKTAKPLCLKYPNEHNSYYSNRVHLMKSLPEEEK